MKGELSSYLELTKPRVTALVLGTTAAGFYLGSAAGFDALLFLNTLLGVGLAAAGTSALNQYAESDADAKMLRTRMRPIPSGRLASSRALAFASAISLAGLVHLAVTVNLLTSALVGMTLFSYIFVYTPLKRVTPFSTLIGAIPGALPPLAGWTAASGDITPGGLALFGILFVWQMPHSLAIAWMYREDYRRGGFALLPVVDPEGGSTGRQILAQSLVLLPVSLLPAVLGVTGPAYFVGALVLGMLLLVAAAPTAFGGTTRAARRLLIASVLYLPLLLGLMALDRSVPPLQ